MQKRRSTPISLLLMLGTAPAFGAEVQTVSSQPTYDPSTHTYTVEEPPTERFPAPSTPMEYHEAVLHWSGAGELLLKPSSNDGIDNTFGIGATFKTYDTAAGPESSDDARPVVCPKDTMWYRMGQGRLRLLWGGSNQREQISRAGLPKDSHGLTLGTDQCRYHLVITTKSRDSTGWITTPYLPHPPAPPPKPIGPTIHLGAGDKFVMKAGPLPQELIPLPIGSGLGGRLPDEFSAKCPKLTGMITVDRAAVYFEQAWRREPPVTPGIRRDEQGRATTLIFENADCREEITVTRETKGDEGWQPSPLSDAPQGSAK